MCAMYGVSLWSTVNVLKSEPTISVAGYTESNIASKKVGSNGELNGGGESSSCMVLLLTKIWSVVDGACVVLLGIGSSTLTVLRRDAIMLQLLSFVRGPEHHHK